MAATTSTAIRPTVKIVTVRRTANAIPASLQSTALATIAAATIRATVTTLALLLTLQNFGLYASVNVGFHQFQSHLTSVFSVQLVGSNNIGIVVTGIRATCSQEHGSNER
jgi:hypothetical protein